MKIHSYVKLRKTLGMAPGKLEESDKILGKTYGLGPTQKKTLLNDLLKGGLHRLN